MDSARCTRRRDRPPQSNEPPDSHADAQSAWMARLMAAQFGKATMLWLQWLSSKQIVFASVD
jgi:hypothetical protein